MKRLMASAAALALILPTAAGAEIVGNTEEGYIHRLTAPGGQEIYLVSPQEEVFLREEDVNFDGQMDLVAVRSLGASNAFCELFIREGETYAWAEHPAVTGGLPNISFYPEMGLVHTRVNNGWAGSLWEEHIFRWEGKRLVPVRRAASDALETYTSEGGRHTTVRDESRLHIRCWDGAGTLLWEETIPAGEMTAEDFVRWQEKLWQGLAPERTVVAGDSAQKVHLRAAPTTDAASLGLWFGGAPVGCPQGITKGWTAVEVGALTGYIRSDLLTATSLPAGSGGSWGMTAGRTLLRAAPDADGAVLAELPSEEPVMLLGETASGWHHVWWQGQEGYIPVGQLADDEGE